MSFGLQVDDVYSGRHVIISEVNPCSEEVPIDGDNDNLNPVSRYYMKLDSISATVAGTTDLNFVLGDGGGAITITGVVANMAVLCLSGTFRSKCFTVVSLVDSNTIRVQGEFTAPSTIELVYFTVIHTASTMYDYCVTNSHSCISINTKSVKWTNGSPENPKSYADHTTLRTGSGKFKQALVMGACEIWDSNPLKRIWLMDQINELIYQWHKLNNNKAVYLIVTTEYDVGGVTYYQNKNFFYKFVDAPTINGRGYLKGFPMKSDGSMDMGISFGINFSEAWF